MHSLAETFAKSIGIFDSLGKSSVGEGLGIALPPFVSSMGRITKCGNAVLVQANGLERHRKTEFLVKGGIACKILFITDVGEQNEDAETYDFTVKIATKAVDRATCVIERMSNARVVIEIILVGEV